MNEEKEKLIKEQIISEYETRLKEVLDRPSSYQSSEVLLGLVCNELAEMRVKHKIT